MPRDIVEDGRPMLRGLVEEELESEARDVRPEMAQLRARLGELNTKIDSVIDLAASSPENKDLLTDRLGRLRREKQEMERRLAELDEIPARVFDPEAVVDTLLDGLADARQLFERGTMEERKRVVRAFVEGLTIDGLSGCQRRSCLSPERRIKMSHERRSTCPLGMGPVMPAV